MQDYHALLFATYDRETKVLTEERDCLLKLLSSLEVKKQELLKVRRYGENEIQVAEKATLKELSSRLGRLACESGWATFHLNFWRFHPMRDLVFSRLLLLGQHPAKGRVGGTHQDWLDGKPRLRVASARAKPVPLVDECLGRPSKDMREQRKNVMASELCNISFGNCLLLIANISCELIRKILLRHVLQATWHRERFAWVRLLGPWKLDVAPSIPPAAGFVLPTPYEEYCRALTHRRHLCLVVFDKETLRSILDPQTNAFGVFMPDGSIWPSLLGNVRRLLLLFIQQFLTQASVESGDEIGEIDTRTVARRMLQIVPLRRWLKQVGNPIKVKTNSSFEAFEQAMCSLVDTEARIVTMLRVTQWLSELVLVDIKGFHTNMLLSCVPKTPRNTEQLRRLGNRAYYRMIDKGVVGSCGWEMLSLVHGGHVLYMKPSVPFVLRKMILSFLYPAYTNSYGAITSSSNRSNRTIILLEAVWKGSPPHRDVEFVKI